MATLTCVTVAARIPRQPDAWEPATGLRFRLDLGGVTIERFVSCEGIGGEYEVDEWKEGGNVGFVHRLPARLKFTNVKMTRPVDRDSGALATWFSQARKGLARRTVTVTACDANGRDVASWHLAGAWPLKYTGPVLSAKGGTDVAIETIELAHNGFTVSAG